jgi:hypothetical protein
MKRNLKLLLAIFPLLYMIASYARAIDPALVVTIEFGDIGKEADYHYQLRAQGEKAVRFTLWEGQSMVEEGEFEYPDGFKGFVGDLWTGYAEASGKYDYERRDKGGNELMIQLEITMGSGLNTLSLTYRGNVDGFNRFGKASLNLQRPLSVLSSGRPRGYRLWGPMTETKK